MISKGLGARCGERHPEHPHVSCHRMAGHGRDLAEWADKIEMHAGYDAVHHVTRRWSSTPRRRP